MVYLGYSVSIYIHSSLHFEHVQFCDMSVSNPLIHLVIMEPPVSTWYFLQNGFMCVLKDIVNVKHLLDKNLTSFIR